MTTFEAKGRLPKGSQPVQKHIFEDPLYSSTLDYILVRAPLPENPNERLLHHRESIKIAAKVVRDTASSLKPFQVHSRATFPGAVSRAAYAQDVKLAK
jgi:hypothetical protein